MQCAYLKILQFENSSTVQSLVLHYAKVVAASEETSFIVRSLFEGIERKQSITLNVTLLAEVLSESFGKVVYVPEKAFKVLFACMHSDIHSPKFVGMVLKLLNRVQQTISKSQP